MESGIRALFHLVYEVVSRSTKTLVVSVPFWFVPSFVVEGNQWDGAEVLVLADSATSKEESRLTEQAALWSSLHDPNLLRLIGASHVGDCFMMFEPGTILRDCDIYPRNCSQMWKWLYDVAKGLQYLHDLGIAVRKFSCENIVLCDELVLAAEDEYASWLDVIAGDTVVKKRVAKLVGTSLVVKELKESLEPAAILADDLFTFGCCIVEAVTGARIDLAEDPGDKARSVRHHFSDEAWVLADGLLEGKSTDILSVVGALRRIVYGDMWVLTRQPQTDPSLATEEEEDSQVHGDGDIFSKLSEMDVNSFDKLAIRLVERIMDMHDRLIKTTGKDVQLGKVAGVASATFALLNVGESVSPLEAMIELTSLHQTLDDLMDDLGWGEDRSVAPHNWNASPSEYFELLDMEPLPEPKVTSEVEWEQLEQIRVYESSERSSVVNVDEELENATEEISKSGGTCEPDGAQEVLVTSGKETSEAQAIGTLIQDPNENEWFISRSEVLFDKGLPPISQGGFCDIYRGKWKITTVAIKCIEIRSSEDMQAFLQQLDIWRQIRHPNILPFYGACHRGSPAFFVTELATHRTVIEYLDRQKDAGKALVWQMLYEAAVGLHYLHSKGIVHGDLKGHKILVGADGRAMLCGFGESFFDDSDSRRHIEHLWAIRWRAPEYVLKGIASVSFASDVYSLGMCIIEAVTKEVPWGRGLSNERIKDLLHDKLKLRQPKEMSDEAWVLVSSMCAYEPSERLALVDVIDRLEAFAEIEKENAWQQSIGDAMMRSDIT